MKNHILDKLIDTNTIHSYEYTNRDECGERFENAQYSSNKMRNTQQLKITFVDGKTLTIDTLCGGSLENTNLLFS